MVRDCRTCLERVIMEQYERAAALNKVRKEIRVLHVSICVIK